MATEAPQNTPFFKDISPETSIRAYDQAIKNWLTSFRYRNQTPKVVTAWMSRYFSQKKDIQGDKTQRAAMPFPMISLGVGSITPDLDRRNVNDVWVLGRGAPSQLNRAYWPNPGVPGSSKEDREAMLLFPYPLPYDISYQIDIWAKNRYDWRLLVTALLSRFSHTDMMYLDVEIPGYGSKLIPVMMSSCEDTSDLETGEDERVLRSTVSLTLKGWIWRVPKVKKTILKAHAVIIDASGSGNLDDGSPFLDWYGAAENYNFNADGSRLLSVDESPDFSPPNRALFWVSYQDGIFTEVGTQAG